MSYIGTCTYVIGTYHYDETWYLIGLIKKDGIQTASYSKDLSTAKRYDDEQDARDDIASIQSVEAHMILEIQKCPKCGKEFTEHPALSREDNETEICPECGVEEAVKAYAAFQNKHK